MPGPSSFAAIEAKAVLIRAVEERLLSLFAEGKLFGTVHTCIGQEWTGVAVGERLRPGDFVFSNHRGHGHYIAFTDDVEGLIAEVMGRQSGVCGGRGGSQHLCHPKGFFTNGIQGGIVPVTAGLALGLELSGKKDSIAVVFIGDGTLGEGALYETLNIASKWNLPLLIVLENNGYAQSTNQRQTLAGDIESRATAFGVRAMKADTWDPPTLVARAAEAVDLVRTERKPLFLRVDTYRLMAHSKGDDDRDPAEVKSYWEKDPIQRFIVERPDEAAQARAAADERVSKAVAAAAESPFAAASDSDSEPLADSAVSMRWTPVASSVESDRVVNRIHEALHAAMTRDERIVLIGEDIEGPYGGAFKVTKNLNAEFPGRVRNTPISEAAIAGIGNGLALAGRVPVCEIMFGDFLTLAADQWINHAAKFRYMYNNQVRVPLVIRTPMGGRRGYGATHSQSIEKHFLGLPGTQVLALHHRADPAVVYEALFGSIDRPTLVIENKLLYGHRINEAPPRGFVAEITGGDFPTLRLRPDGATPDLTILCYGEMLSDAEKALDLLFDEHEIVAEIVCPLRLYPLDPRPIADSLRRSRRLLVAEEGIGFAAFGAEAIAQIVESHPGVIARLARLSSPLHPIPCCGPLEKQILPGTPHIVEAATRLMTSRPASPAPTVR